MASSETQAYARRWFAKELRKPEYVAQVLDDIQHTACAGIMRYPELAADCTGHLFSAPDPLYLSVFRSVRFGITGLVEITETILRKAPLPALWPYDLAYMFVHYPSRSGAVASIAQLKAFVAWQYRQEKARRKAA